jgi:hypothetical protein
MWRAVEEFVWNRDQTCGRLPRRPAPPGPGQSRSCCVAPSPRSNRGLALARRPFPAAVTAVPARACRATCCLPSARRSLVSSRRLSKKDTQLQRPTAFVTNRKLTRHARELEYKQGNGIPSTSDHAHNVSLILPPIVPLVDTVDLGSSRLLSPID